LDHLSLRKVDSVIYKVLKYISYVCPVILVYMAVSATVDVIATKAFGRALNNINDYIEYLLIAVIYCGAPFVQISTGFVRVDIIYGKFPRGLKRVINLIAYAAATALYAVAGYQGLSLLRKHIASKQLASSALSSFQIWPFTLVYIIGTFLLAVILLWSVVRLIFIPDVVLDEPPAEAPPLEADTDKEVDE